MSLSDCSILRDEKRIGSVQACLGGSIEVWVGNYRWVIDPRSLFEAVEKLNHQAAEALGPDHWIPATEKPE